MGAIYFWVNIACKEYVRWYFIMRLLWISGKCDLFDQYVISFPPQLYFTPIDESEADTQEKKKKAKEKKNVVAQKFLFNAV